MNENKKNLGKEKSLKCLFEMKRERKTNECEKVIPTQIHQLEIPF